jgi:hypothetical protein
MVRSLFRVRSIVLVAAFLVLGTRARVAAQTANAHAHPSDGYRVAGTIVNKLDGRPLARARVTLGDAKGREKPLSLVTSDDGKFEFRGLPAGKFSLEGAKHEFLSAGYDQHDQFATAIVTGAGIDTEALILRLLPAAVISGRVLDEAGEPVRHATVMSYYNDHAEGVDQVHQLRSAETDDLGSYEMAPLMPGTYFLSVNATPWYAVHPYSNPNQPDEDAPSDRSLDVAYPVTYYADATEAEDATAIPLRGGDRVQVDIHLNPVPALHVVFRIPGDGKNGFSFPQLEQPAFDGSTFVQTNGAQMSTPGILEMTGIPAGRYNIRVSGQSSSLQMNGVDLSKDGQEIDTTSAESMGNVKVSVRMEGEGALPPRLGVGLHSGHKTISAWQMVDAKGEAELQSIAAGRYEMIVGGAMKRYSIARISAEGAEVSGRTLTVPAGASVSVALTLVGGTAEVQGTVKRAGKGFAGAMVVLVPKSPELDRELFRRDQSDLDGTFSLRGVVPGTYTVLAIDNGWDLDWSQPGVIAAYMKHGHQIEVGSHGSTVNLAEPVEVQSK